MTWPAPWTPRRRGCSVTSEPSAAVPLLGAAALRARAAELGVKPTKELGQNFVHDANTVRRIVRAAGVTAGERVLEVGPGLGSLTRGLLAVGASVVAVELDPVLAAGLAELSIDVVVGDAARVRELPGRPPQRLVANLPYNVSVPVLLHCLETFASLRSALVMVQAEVGHRLAAPPGSRTYGIPSVKAAWWGEVRVDSTVPRAVFWPVPNVDSVLVRVERRPEPGDAQLRRVVFAAVDAAFSQRRKTLRSALSGWAGSATQAEQLCRTAGIDHGLRGEQLGLEQFVALGRAALP
jgi:16S rRNA (adenine1518-N6/adenine1519-N6)-dimethyltransferase